MLGQVAAQGIFRQRDGSGVQLPQLVVTIYLVSDTLAWRAPNSTLSVPRLCVLTGQMLSLACGMPQWASVDWSVPGLMLDFIVSPSPGRVPALEMPHSNSVLGNAVVVTTGDCWSP